MSPIFTFIRIASMRGSVWQVREGGTSGPLLGAVSEEDGGWVASRVKSGELVTKWHRDRDAAASWLASITPKQGRRRA